MKFIDLIGERVSYRKGRRIDYHRPKTDLTTPRISEPKVNWWRGFKLFLALAVLSGTGWLIFLSGFFDIKEILIEGEAGPEIIQEVENLRGQNIFLLGGRRAEENLKHQQPGIQRIRIVRGLPATLKVELVERDALLTWETQGKKYLVDSSGVVFKETDKDKFFLIKDSNNIQVELGRQIIDPDFVEFVRLVNQEIPLRTELKIVYFEVVETTYQIQVVTDGNKRIILNTMRQITPQVTALKKVWEEHKDEIGEYIDLRVEGMVYYK